MRVIGKYMDSSYRSHQVPKGSHIVLEVHAAEIDTYNGKPIGVCEQCFIVLHSGYFIYHVLSCDGDYYSAETAIHIINDMAYNMCIDLEKYNMALYAAIDIRPDEIHISNALDEDYNPIPIQVATK